MPWRVESVLDQRKAFVVERLKSECAFSELCREFGVSRKTGYKWMERFNQSGFPGLEDLDRCPENFREPVSAELVCEITKVRVEHESWGGRKIRQYLVRQKRFDALPCSRTIDRILKRSGLVTARSASIRVSIPPVEVVKPKSCNDVATSDFKGWWHMDDGNRCNPLTVRDEHARFILGLVALSETTFDAVKEHFEEVFIKYGLPLYMRFDNGPPFASIRGFMRLTQFGVWLLKLGVTPNPIAPASPYMNGAHERMHRDLKRELQRKPDRNLKAEQKRFDAWRHEFNHVRPHDALGGKTPAECYKRSARKYYREVDFDYPADFVMRNISNSGEFNWCNRPVFFSKAFAGQTIGIERVGDGLLKLWFYDYALGVADDQFRSVSEFHQPKRYSVGRRYAK